MEKREKPSGALPLWTRKNKGRLRAKVAVRPMNKVLRMNGVPMRPGKPERKADRQEVNKTDSLMEPCKQRLTVHSLRPYFGMALSIFYNG